MARQARGKEELVGKGRGGAKDWIAVRLNSLALLFFYSWLLISLLLLPDFSYAVVRNWLGQSMNSVLMVLLIAMSFWHVKFGLKELIDDYVHQPFSQAVALTATYAFVIFGTAFGIWSVARISLLPS
jgi:succinate dehydrogenase / fumarate reductase, membrane anchor subunit